MIVDIMLWVLLTMVVIAINKCVNAMSILKENNVTLENKVDLLMNRINLLEEKNN